eukprot:1906833-Amphidinium_carterae.1
MMTVTVTVTATAMLTMTTMTTTATRSTTAKNQQVGQQQGYVTGEATLLENAEDVHYHTRSQRKGAKTQEPIGSTPLQLDTLTVTNYTPTGNDFTTTTPNFCGIY